MRSESPVLQVNLVDDEFLTMVRNSLRRQPRSIPPKFFYDARGSELFELICTTPEYYLTRTETAILDKFGAEMADRIGAPCVLIELGSGSASKTPLLLRHLVDDSAYVPIDICEPYLKQSTQRLNILFPEIHMHPVCADYMRLPSVDLDGYADHRRVIFFPGSTIGNCTPIEVAQLLRHTAQLVGANGAMLIGVDSKKSPAVLNAAYNDAAGFTAAFNQNLLIRMQRELGIQLDLDGFAHYAYYNAALGRIEMHLVSQKRQTIKLDNEVFQFDEGETIHTENSYKYTTHEFQQLARAAGWHPKMQWSDPNGMFNVYYLSLDAREPQYLPQSQSPVVTL
jgi:L-histidine N-alpha-methyltransferase